MDLIIQKLIDKKIVELQEEVQEQYKPKLVRYIRLHEDYAAENNLIALLDSIRGAKQKEVLMH